MGLVHHWITSFSLGTSSQSNYLITPMSHCSHQSDPETNPFQYLSYPQKSVTKRSLQTQCHLPGQVASDGVLQASTSRQSLHTSTNPFKPVINHHFPLKPSKANATVTSPGWDPIGDNDEIYIQSDDTHLRDVAGGSRRLSVHTRNSILNQSLTHMRKRKRSPQPIIQDPTSNASRHSSTSTSSRAPLKYDDEGCANCFTKQSTCWWKKSKAITLHDGTEAWGEEKLCNPCSIHWNKNGYHRRVKLKAPPELPQACLTNLPSCSLSSRPSCSTALAAAGPSSPTASLTKTNPAILRRAHQSHSPSQLTMAAEKEDREAQIVQRSLAKACAKSDALRQKQRIMKFGYISEEEDGLVNKPPMSPPPAPLQLVKSSIQETSSLNQTLNLQSVEFPPQKPFFSNAATLSHQHSSNDLYLGAEAPLENTLTFPPRTPPSNSYTGSRKCFSLTGNSPDQTFDFGNILSPSFLNASPNSLLRRLDQQKPNTENVAGSSHLSATCLSSFPVGISEKVFSPNRQLASNSPTQPTPPVAEPVKKAKVPSNKVLLGSAGLLDAHMNSGSSIHTKKSIFSPSRPTLNSRQSAGRKSKFKSAKVSSESIGQLLGSSRVHQSKKDGLDEHQNGTRITLDQTNFDALLEPVCLSSKRVPHSSRKKSHAQSTSRSQSQTNHHMARTIWSRHFESAAISSEDSHLEEMFTRKFGCRSPLESLHSETNSTGTPIERGIEQTGLSSAVSKGLNQVFSADGRGPSQMGSGIGHSDGNMVSASSPPVLPPPSDCSEGITPQSDDGEKDHKNPSVKQPPTDLSMLPSCMPDQLGAQDTAHSDFDLHDHPFPLSDITRSLNHQYQHNPLQSRPQNTEPDQQNQSSEIMRVLDEAIKAGLSAEELVHAVRNFNSSGSALAVNHNSHDQSHSTQFSTNNSILGPLSDIPNQLIEHSTLDPTQFFLHPTPVPPIHSTHNFDDHPQYHPINHYVFPSDHNVDPILMGEIESILNQPPNN